MGSSSGVTVGTVIGADMLKECSLRRLVHKVTMTRNEI